MDTTIQYNTTSSWKAELSLALRSPGAACVAAYVLLCYVLMSTVWAKQYWRPLPGEFIDDGSQWVKDPRVDVPFHDETVPYFPHLTIISYGIPLAVLVLRGFLTHRAAGDVRAFLYAFFPAMATTNLANTWIKRYVGRLRPFFYQRCGYDASTFACTDDKDLLRQSFPSGHSSESMCALLFCTLFLLGKVKLRRSLLAPREEDREEEGGGQADRGPSRLPFGLGAVRLAPAWAALATLPTCLSVWIACSRLRDDWHHPADVLAGLLLGASCALFFYPCGFPPVFADDSHLPLVSPGRGGAARHRDAAAAAAAGDERSHLVSVSGGGHDRKDPQGAGGPYQAVAELGRA
jgi:diacylglycerol diphosphate phosphatase/phosphatidate phosphatase